MALFVQLQRMESEQNLDIFGYVRAMRCKRNCMVQTEVSLGYIHLSGLGHIFMFLYSTQPQYVFIHDALLEAIECGVTEVLARELQEQYRQLCEVDVETKVTGIAMQFDNLERTIHRKLRRYTGTLIVNKPKNRYGANPDTIPCMLMLSLCIAV